MLKELLTPEIVQLIHERSWTALREALVIWPPAEVADLLESLEQPERVLVLRFLPRYYEAEVFSELSPKLQDEILGDLTNHDVRRLLADLSPDDRTALIDEMPAEVTHRLFSLLSPEDLNETRQLLGYPEGSVGRVMTPNFVDIKAEMTVENALVHIRKHGGASETINIVYVTDERKKLIDEITLRHLILAPPDATVKDLMDGNVVSLNGYSEVEEAVSMIKKYNYLALPVVDTAGILLGIVTIDDLMDVAEEKVTEDFHQLGAVSIDAAGDGAIESIREAAVSVLFRRRIYWLLLLVFVNIFSGFGISLFESTLATVALVFFLPILIGSGGNAGSQSATLLVRALATGDVVPKDIWAMLGKELLVSAMLGVTLSVAVFGIALFRGIPNVGIVASVAMFLIVMFGSLVGMLFPFLLQKIGKDPATASAPLVTSIVDICGVVIYLSIASRILSQ